MARRRRKASLHSAGKVVQKDLLERARELADDPDMAVPVCTHACGPFCPFKRARRLVARIAERKDDAKFLDKQARGRNRLARAYAATLRFALEGNVPIVAELRLPSGNVPYVARGKATPFELAGLQHHDEPHLHLLAMSHYVKKRGRHVYATEDGLVCTGRHPHPPEEFVAAELEAAGLTETKDGRWVCEHGGADGGDALVITWKSAGVTAEWAEASLDAGEHVLHRLARHIAAPRMLADFDVTVKLRPLEGDGAPDVTPDLTDAVALYKKQALDDPQLIDRARAARAEALRARGGRAFVAGTKWYGEDAAALIDALNPTEPERRALEAALAEVDRPVVVWRTTATRVLAEVWQDAGHAALRAAASGHEATADRLYKPDAGPEDIGDLVKRAASRGASAAVNAALPTFKRLPPQAAVADAIARAHRAGGRDEGARVALQKARETSERGIPLAFLRVLGGTGGHDWKFSHVDQEVADALQADAQTLLECEAGDYADVLERLSRRAGATQGVEVG